MLLNQAACWPGYRFFSFRPLPHVNPAGHAMRSDSGYIVHINRVLTTLSSLALCVPARCIHSLLVAVSDYYLPPCPEEQYSNTFTISPGEKFVTRRDIVGVWWSDLWELKKMIYIELEDGTKKARASCTQRRSNNSSSSRQDNLHAC